MLLRFFATIALSSCLAIPGLTLALHAQQRPGERPEIVVVRLVLRPQGFSPAEITVSEGIVRIEVLNRVGFPELPMLLEREARDLQPKMTLRQEPFLLERPKWDQQMLLEPGTYVVSVEGRPKWTSRITVVANQ